MPDGKPKTSKLAIWSLVLSIVGFFTCMITSIPALICGICGLVKISKSKGQLKGKGLAITGIIITAVSLTISLPVGLISFNKAFCTGRQIACEQNLSELKKAMTAYIHDYNNIYPSADKWCDSLIEKAKVEKYIFICFGSKAKTGTSCYVLNINAAGKKVSELPPDMVLIFETNTPGWNMAGGRELLSTKNHQGDGCNVLYVDGHCKFEKDPNSLRWTVE